jgi:predicted phosphate transport protein (TIGR00153 family)
VKRRALDICEEHLRKVIDLTRKIPQMIETFINNDKEHTKQIFNEIIKSHEEVDNARRMVSEELAKIGAILLSREDFLRFTNLANEIADFCEGAGFRILEIMQHEWNIPIDLKKKILTLSEAVLETILKLREAMIVLSYGSSKTMEKAREVEIAERAVDDLYREVEINLINSKLDVPALILLRDVLQLLEDCADKAEDAADITRILSFII